MGTPVRTELEKLRQASESPRGLTAVLTSSPATPGFFRGMATYRPGGKAVLSFEKGKNGKRERNLNLL